MKSGWNKITLPLLFTLLLSLCSSPKRGIIILCAGDSITEANYPHFLQKICHDEGTRVKVFNYGKSGHTSREYLNFLKRNTIALARKHPDFVLLQLGTNDVRSDSDSTSTDEFYSNMKNIIKIFRGFRNRSGKEIHILLATIPPIPIGSPFPFSPESSARVTDEINPLIQKICTEENLILVDNYSLFTHSPHLLPEVHPTREGYKHIAQNWFNALKPFLKK